MESFPLLKPGTTFVYIFSGSEKGVQVRAFMVALGANLAKRHITNVKVVIMATTDLRAAKYSSQKFVDWLLGCDIHFILSPVHQSLNFWDCREIAPQYTRLIGHRGFSTGQQHFCCIFLQDKIIYLHALRDYCNPTVQIHIPWCEESKEADILSMSTIPLEAERSFVVKTPFTTNCDNFKIVHSLQEVMQGCHLFVVLVIALSCPGNRTSAIHIRRVFAPTPVRDDSSLHDEQARSQSCLPQW